MPDQILSDEDLLKEDDTQPGEALTDEDILSDSDLADQPVDINAAMSGEYETPEEPRQYIPREDAPELTPKERALPTGGEAVFGEAVGSGLTEGFVLDFDDEIAAGTQVGKLLADGEITEAEAVREYKRIRDNLRVKTNEAAKEHPYAYNMAKMAGMALSASVPINMAKTARGKWLLSGVVAGFQGLGSSEADLTEGEYTEAAKDAGKQAALDLGIGYAGGKVGAVSRSIKKRAGRLRQSAEESVLNALGAYKRDFDKASRLGNQRKIGRQLLDSDVVKFFSDFDDIAENVAPKLAETGRALGAKRQAYMDAAKRLPDELYDVIHKPYDEFAHQLKTEPFHLESGRTLNIREIEETIAGSPLAENMKNMIDDWSMTKQGRVDFDTIRKELEIMDQSINGFGKEQSLQKEAVKALRRKFRQEEERLARALDIALDLEKKGGTGVWAKLKKTEDIGIDDAQLKVFESMAAEKAKKLSDIAEAVDKGSRVDFKKEFYAAYREAADIAQNKINALAQNRKISLTDYLAMIQGQHLAAGGIAAGGIAAGADPVASVLLAGTFLGANRIVRTRGASMWAKTADKLADALESNKAKVIAGAFDLGIELFAENPVLYPALSMALTDENSPINVEGFMTVKNPEMLNQFKLSIQQSDKIKNTEKAKILAQIETDGGLVIGSLGPVKTEEKKDTSGARERLMQRYGR
jgi:hypothetical protein